MLSPLPPWFAVRKMDSSPAFFRCCFESPRGIDNIFLIILFWQRKLRDRAMTYPIGGLLQLCHFLEIFCHLGLGVGYAESGDRLEQS